MAERKVLNMDADLGNADWMKTSADFSGMTPAEFVAFVDGQPGGEAAFRSLPVYGRNQAYFNRLLAAGRATPPETTLENPPTT